MVSGLLSTHPTLFRKYGGGGFCDRVGGREGGGVGGGGGGGGEMWPIVEDNFDVLYPLYNYDGLPIYLHLSIYLSIYLYLFI